MKEIENINLFVYGTLMSDYNLRIITGKEFTRKEALLFNYRKVTPKDSFPFVVQKKGKITQGTVIFDVGPETMKVLDRYETVGHLYNRKKVKVQCEGEIIDADLYVGNVRNIKKAIERDLDIVDRIEDQLEAKIDQLMKAGKPGEAKDLLDESLLIRIKKELLGSATETIIKAHFEWLNLPTFMIEKAIHPENLPRLSSIKNDPEIEVYADNYISFAVRHMVFNQIEEKIRHQFRGSVRVDDEYYLHSVSMLIALKYLNSKKSTLRDMMIDMGANRFEKSLEYIDYARKSILIADAVYSEKELKNMISWVKDNSVGGVTSMGAELEFSNSGYNAISAPPGDDKIFDNFYYFDDFDLDRRLWKLGGYIDDHKYAISQKIRRRGFLEYAFGRYKVLGDLSKPVTHDPWILANLILEGARFADVKPHSLQISIQIDKPADCLSISKESHLICLLLLGGDLGYDSGGKLREKRIFCNELIDNFGNLNFSHEKVHNYTEDSGETGSQIVIEYGFARLCTEKDYEPLIVALKGYQIGANPRPLNPISEERGLLAITNEEKDNLISWALSPWSIDIISIDEFLEVVKKGLETEKNGFPAHKKAYIEKILDEIRAVLMEKNEFIKSSK